MAAILIFLLFVFHLAEAQQRYSNISLGSSLTSDTNNSSWFSPSRLYAFGFSKQGDSFVVGIFLAGIPEKTVVWTANRDKNLTVPGNVTLVLTVDGRLILQQSEGQERDIVIPGEPISSASMLDNGNFVLYDGNQTIIWQSFDHPTNTILPGQRLSPEMEIISSASETDFSRGIFRLRMQGDGNLVQYPIDAAMTPLNSYYSTGTNGDGNNISLNLDYDGHLYLLNETSILKNLTEGYSTNRTIYIMRIDVDGVFRVYSHPLDNGNWSVSWYSSNDICSSNGLCGLNGFCVITDKLPDCRCLPGFDFINPDKWSLGCERNFPLESCKAKDAISGYVMRRIGNIVWEEDVPNVVLEEITIENCEEACLKNCNCEAVIFKEQTCSMYGLPLRYLRRLFSGSSIAIIKVGMLESIANEVPVYVSEGKKKVLPVDILIASISLIVFAFLVLGISGILIRRTHLRAYKKIGEVRNVELIDGVAPCAFTYTELMHATNDFGEELGRGAFGTVYKGIISDIQKEIAVKRLDKVLEEGEHEFQTEMKVIGKTYHRNLVQLFGYCADGSKRLLVYEFMSGGSLADILFKPGTQTSWDDRMRIALDIARGILYLHEECEVQIIHCDIKSQNILMDENMCAKISDFGLAKLLKHDQTKTYTGIRGTKGYVAPEWHRNLPITTKADVYSFGIVLLEIICSRKSVDWSLPENEAVLEEWVFECFQAGELSKLVHDEEVDRKRLEKSVRIGIWCIQDEPSLRPSMRKVLLMLEGTVEIPIPPSPASFLCTT